MLRVYTPLALALALATAGCGATLVGDSDEEDHAALLGDSAAPDAWAEPTFEATSTCKKGQPQLAYGLHPGASDALRCAAVAASRISQTIGSAPASAGTHAKDGVAGGRRYSAATDLRTRDLSEAQIKALLGKLDALGFAAWYRKPGADGWPASEAPHIHAVFAGCAMKASLRAQVGDWLAGKNGLASHTPYRFYQPTAAMRTTVRTLFDKHN